MDSTRKNETVNIACLLWKGVFRGRNFTEQDVNRLRASVDKWIDRPYRFYCLTNDPSIKINGGVVVLKNNWPGWWSKVELFRKDLPVGRTLYLDLDSHVVSGLKPLLEYEGDLVMFPASKNIPKMDPERLLRQKGLVHRYQASTMLFTPGALSWVYDRFLDHAQTIMRQFRSEQDMYGVWLPNQPTFPREWLSKLAGLRAGVIPKKTIIITGQPRDTSFRAPSYVTQLETVARG